jgi:hypothetical protein
MMGNRPSKSTDACTLDASFGDWFPESALPRTGTQNHSSFNMRIEVDDEVMEGLSRLVVEAVLHGRDLAIALVHFNPLDAMHRKKDGVRRDFFTGNDLAHEVVKRIEVDAAQADAGSGDGNDGSPIFLARRIQGDHDNRPGGEFLSRAKFLRHD